MAVSASVSGYISMIFFKHDVVMVRKCTIIGMSAGLSAFFGVQLGGKCCLLWSCDDSRSYWEQKKKGVGGYTSVRFVTGQTNIHRVLSRRLLPPRQASLPQ